MEIKKNINETKLVARDFITIAIVAVLHYVLFAILTPIGMIPIGSVFIYSVGALMWGSLFVLLCSKVNKTGAVFAYGLLIGLIQMANFWLTGLIVIIGALIAEVVWNKIGRKKFISIAVSFVIFVLSLYLCVVIPLLFLTDMSMSALAQYAELYTAVYELLQGPVLYIGLAATIAGSVAGIFIGKALMKKHFKKAGII